MLETGSNPGDIHGSPIDGFAKHGLDSTAVAHQSAKFLIRATNASSSQFQKKGVLTVNKNDLIAEVSTETGLSKGDAARAVDAVFDSITKSLKKGTEVRLVGFGTFVVTKRAASEGRNPRTGEKIKIPASKQPKFKAGKALKDAVN
jgi:DNA-binding protein HU-beta